MADTTPSPMEKFTRIAWPLSSVIVLFLGMAFGAGLREQRINALDAASLSLSKKLDDNTQAVLNLSIQVARLAQRMDDTQAERSGRR